jgi:hypothetical protein
VPDRPERENLPELLAGSGKQVDERKGRRPQITDSVLAGERGDVEQDATDAP